MKDARKKWTVLIYANGNNDLEPEIWQAKLVTERVVASNDINIVLEIGRLDKTLVEDFRPKLTIWQRDEEWTGVRRYLLTNGQSVLLADLGKRNMADANNLYQFIKYGIESFPAERYIAVLGGHGYQFVGSMPDYSQELPYIMGFPEMAKALDRACDTTGEKIELLLADICYFNFIEVIYEFARHPGHGVQNILTYICDGPICGMPYHEIIAQLDRQASNSMRDVVSSIIRSIRLDLVAFALEHTKLEFIRQTVNSLAEIYDKNKTKSEYNLNEILFVADPQLPWNMMARQVLRGLEDIIIAYRRETPNDYGLINIANIPAGNDRLNLLYTKLSFTKNNSWTSLLIDPSFIKKCQNQADSVSPLVLAPEEVYAYISIMNNELTKDEKISILKKIIKYKKWVWDTNL